MDQREVLAAQISFNRNVMIAGCTLALLATLIALWLARSFLEPLKSLLHGISEMRDGTRRIAIPVNSNDEFSDLIRSFNAMSETIAERDETIQKKSHAYERLLKQIFPETIADRMKQGEATIVESFQQVTVIYAIVEGFADYARQRDGDEALKLLNEIVDRFDASAEADGIEKVKTIGDHYLAVSGLAIPRIDHARRALEFAARAWRDLAAVNAAHGLSLRLRVGIATGPTQAGLVGNRRFVYDIWGIAPSLACSIAHKADIECARLDGTACAQVGHEELSDELAIEGPDGVPNATRQVRLSEVRRS